MPTTELRTEDIKDIEYTLQLEGVRTQTVTVSPYGASLRSYAISNENESWDVIWPYQGGSQKKGGQGDVLLPFPGRIKNGTYSFEGQAFQLPKNDKDGPNAIHGFLRAHNWQTKFVSANEAQFQTRMEAEDYRSSGYPFSLELTVIYRLSEDGLETHFSITNVGSTSAPVGAGFHPYFLLNQDAIDTWKVTIPAREYIELEALVPTGRVLPASDSHLDFRKGRTLGAQRYNDCLAHLDRDANGRALIQVGRPGFSRRIELELDRSFDYVVIYSGDQIPAPHGRKAFAIEPLTCASDAFNHPTWGLKVLKAAETFQGSYTIRAYFDK